MELHDSDSAAATSRFSICWGWCHWLTCLTIVVVVRQIGKWVVPDPAAVPTVAARFVVDLNTAELRELQALPDVGPSLAGSIIAHRRAYGPFAAVDELLAVRGVGPRTLEQLRPMLTVAGDRPELQAEN